MITNGQAVNDRTTWERRSWERLDQRRSILFNFGNLNGKRSVSSYRCWFFMKKALCEGLISEVGEPEGTCCSIYHRSFFHQALLNAVCNNAPLPSICRHLSYFFGRGCKPLRFWSGALKDLKGKHLKMSKSWNSDTTLQSQKTHVNPSRKLVEVGQIWFDLWKIVLFYMFIQIMYVVWIYPALYIYNMCVYVDIDIDAWHYDTSLRKGHGFF